MPENIHSLVLVAGITPDNEVHTLFLGSDKSAANAAALAGNENGSFTRIHFYTLGAPSNRFACPITGASLEALAR